MLIEEIYRYIDLCMLITGSHANAGYQQ